VDSLAAGGSSVLTVPIPADAADAAGTFTITMSGVAGTASHSATAIVNVGSSGGPSAQPLPSGSDASGVTVHRVSGMSPSVASGLLYLGLFILAAAGFVVVTWHKRQKLRKRQLREGRLRERLHREEWE
jgi:hypothetical protein